MRNLISAAASVASSPVTIKRATGQVFLSQYQAIEALDPEVLG